jgi:hypothetical protein
MRTTIFKRLEGRLIDYAAKGTVIDVVGIDQVDHLLIASGVIW